MFINIWDEENTTIKINKFDKNLLSNNESFYREAINSCNKEYGIKIDGYKIEFKNSDSYCFNGKLYFSLLLDCFAFLISDTFQYLYESEDIDLIRITSNKEVIFEYDNRR
jgi:hypothetical protein